MVIMKSILAAFLAVMFYSGRIHRRFMLQAPPKQANFNHYFTTKSRTAMAKAAFNKKNLFISRLDLNLRKELLKCYIWSMALYGAETWTLRAADQKHVESFEMWCWRRMEKISWTDHVRKVKGRIEVTRRRGRRRKKLLDDLGERRGYSHLNEEALDRIKWSYRFGRGCGPVV
jgi:hypothetical protein